MSTAYLLVAHGSRDPRSKIALDRLTDLVAQRLGSPLGGGIETVGEINGEFDFPYATTRVLGNPAPLVFSASLEAQDIPLHRQLVNLAQRLIEPGVRNELRILPVFLLMGVHTCEDLPSEITQAQGVLESKLRLSCLPALGLSPLLPAWLEHCFRQYQTQSQGQRILLAHGSKRPGGNQAIANVAEKLGAKAAYCKGGVSLQETLAKLEKPGEVVILPYFLFAGGLTDLIQNQVGQLQLDYPHLQLRLGEPLGPHPVLAQIIAQELQGN